MSDNPFSEPDDSDRTVIRPAPGGRRPAAPAAAPPQQPPPASPFASPFDAPPTRPAQPPPASPFAASPAFAAPVASEGAETISFGLNPLVSAAAPLLQLLGRLRNTYSQPNVEDLRARAEQQIRSFEAQARDGGVPRELMPPAHYALCASIDDVVLNTPWGSQ